jgi:hypothetical protein
MSEATYDGDDNYPKILDLPVQETEEDDIRVGVLT